MMKCKSIAMTLHAVHIDCVIGQRSESLMRDHEHGLKKALITFLAISTAVENLKYFLSGSRITLAEQSK